MLRTKKDIKDIFESIGIKYGIGKFEGIFKRAKEIVNKILIISKIRMMTKYQLKHFKLQSKKCIILIDLNKYIYYY